MALRKTGTIDLSEGRVISIGQARPRGKFSVQMKSTDVSGTTTFSLETSLDGTNWGVAQEAGVDITDTLVQSATKVLSFDADPYAHFRINFAGETTGDVAYIINY